LASYQRNFEAKLVDVIWALFVGIIQLEAIKFQHKRINPDLKSTLRMAEKIIAKATSTGPDNGQRL